MEFALGPCPATEIVEWTRTARRIVVEARELPRSASGPTSGHLDQWSILIENWSRAGDEALSENRCFRWQQEMSPELAEYLLHGFEQCLHTDEIHDWITKDEATALRGTTVAVLHAFTDALCREGAGCQHYVDQILDSLPVEV